MEGLGANTGRWHHVFGFPPLSYFLGKITFRREQQLQAGGTLLQEVVRAASPRMNGTTERIHHQYIELFLH